MNSTYFLIGALLVSVGIAAWVVTATRTFLRYRGKMLFTCPETGKPAAVRVAAGKAASSSLLAHTTVRLSECSRWPERKDCGQECLSQLGANPEDCMVWNKVADWYRGRSCAVCHKPFNTLHWHDHRPALIGPERTTVQWNELAAEKLPEVFATHIPVCWSCHIATTFRRGHPELVTERPHEPVAQRS